MKRINKRSAFTVVLALMLVLSFGFYTGLSPTTAWFHKEYTAQKSYHIGEFDVGFDTYVQRGMTMTFDATTKLSEALAQDTTRNAEFEYAVQYLYVTLTNNVEESRSGAADNYLDALVKLTVGVVEDEEEAEEPAAPGGESEEETEETVNSLRYFCFPLQSGSYYSSVSTDSNGTRAGGDLAGEIRSFCGNHSITTDEAFVEVMNNSNLNDNNNASLIRVPHNSSVTICIALWVDHGDSGVTDQIFPITVSMSARQALAED